MLTVEQIKARATSPREALKVSIEEWTWRAEASEEELRQLGSLGSTSRCGLCRYYSCGECPLNVSGVLATNGGCGLEFKEAYQLYCKWKKGKAKISELRIALWSMVARLDSELAKLPEEKKEEPKREIRIGDLYGRKYRGRTFVVLGPTSDGWDLLHSEGDRRNRWTERDIRREGTWLGNIFDDLAALQEDVEKFDYKGNGSFSFHGEIYGPDRIWLNICTKSSMYDISETEEIILKLRAMVATAKRKQLSKENKK